MIYCKVIPRLRRNTTFYNSFANWLSNFILKKRNFEDNFSAKIEQRGWMKTNMAATSNHPWILSPKYGQTGNVKLLTANRNLSFAVKWPNLDLKVSIISRMTGKIIDISHNPFCLLKCKCHRQSTAVNQLVSLEELLLKIGLNSLGGDKEKYVSQDKTTSKGFF